MSTLGYKAIKNKQKQYEDNLAELQSKLSDLQKKYDAKSMKKKKLKEKTDILETELDHIKEVRASMQNKII